MNFTCKFTSSMCAYSMNAYDLPSSDEDTIRENLKEQGYDVNEIYNIKKQ